jgi:hypothetical protein
MGTHRSENQRNRPLPDVTPGADWNVAAVRFWPDSGIPVNWPPALYLGDKDNIIERFINRFEAPTHGYCVKKAEIGAKEPA